MEAVFRVLVLNAKEDWKLSIDLHWDRGHLIVASTLG
jgi:hypothetical protein